MRMKELQSLFLGGAVEKKLYWSLMRENYTHVLPEFSEVLKNHPECKSIFISGDSVVLEKKSGVKLYFYFEEAMSRAEIDLCNFEDPEKNELEYLAKLLKNKKATMAFDIGANVGMFSLELQKSLNEMEFFLFEPIPTTYSNMQRTLLLNDAEECKFHSYNYGMSNQKGCFTFYLPGESEAASLQPINDEFYLKNSDEFGNYIGKKTKEIECVVTTLDDFVKENNIEKVDFLKIDVEGNEKFVLEGARNTLVKHHPLVYCELLRKHAKRFGYHPNDVISFMSELGYECSTIRDGKEVQISEIDDNTVETNFIFQ